MKTTLLILGILCFGTYVPQTLGCTDPLATNFNPLATQNDGSCTYAPASVSVISSWVLSDSLQETSGLCFSGGMLYSHNDNSDKRIYRIDTLNGVKTGTYNLSPVINIDWEEIAEDQNYFYLGDFGNNAGNRTNLKIYRALKSSVLNNSPVVDSILFSYSDQLNFSPPPNTTNYDCEAMVVGQDSIFLFTKQWGANGTSYYALPKTPGTYTANYRGNINVQGLITGAVRSDQKKLIVLTGYSNLLQPFVFLLYDFQANNFSSGNKRRVSLNLPFHQTEGIASLNMQRFYLSNERFVNGTITVQQQLHLLDLSYLLNPYLTAGVKESETGDLNVTLSPVPFHENIHIDSPKGFQYYLYDMQGTNIVSGDSGGSADLNTLGLSPGIYTLEILSKGQYRRFKVAKL